MGAWSSSPLMSFLEANGPRVRCIQSIFFLKDFRRGTSIWPVLSPSLHGRKYAAPSGGQKPRPPLSCSVLIQSEFWELIHFKWRSPGIAVPPSKQNKCKIQNGYCTIKSLKSQSYFFIYKKYTRWLKNKQSSQRVNSLFWKKGLRLKIVLQ